MLTARDSCVIAATALALLAYQKSSSYYARWKGARARERDPLIPAQIAATDDQMDTCDDGIPRRIRKAETGIALHAVCGDINALCGYFVTVLQLASSC